MSVVAPSAGSRLHFGLWLALLFALSPPIGAEGLNFTLPDLAGRPVRLAGFRGQWVIVNFWASWCVPCRAELASLERLAATRSGRVIVIAASVDEDPRSGKAAFGSNRPHLRLAFASLSAVQNYGALGMPYSIVLDAKGTEVQRVARSIDWTGPEATRIMERAK